MQNYDSIFNTGYLNKIIDENEADQDRRIVDNFTQLVAGEDEGDSASYQAAARLQV